jgi:ribosomal protein S14
MNSYKKELFNQILKTLAHNENIFVSIRNGLHKRFFFINTNNYKSKIVFSCNVNRKNRSVLRCFRFNRLVLANFYSNGLIKGVYKTSW